MMQMIILNFVRDCSCCASDVHARCTKLISLQRSALSSKQAFLLPDTTTVTVTRLPINPWLHDALRAHAE